METYSWKYISISEVILLSYKIKNEYFLKDFPCFDKNLEAQDQQRTKWCVHRQ